MKYEVHLEMLIGPAAFFTVDAESRDGNIAGPPLVLSAEWGQTVYLGCVDRKAFYRQVAPFKLKGITA